MLQKLKDTALATTIWAASAGMALAQTTAPGTTPSTTPGTTTDAGAAAADAGDMNWLWIIVALAVVAALAWYFMRGRNRSTRTDV